MRDKGPFLPVVLTLLLLAAAGFQLVMTDGVELPPVGGGVAVAATRSIGVVGSTEADPAIQERPLFAPGRRVGGAIEGAGDGPLAGAIVAGAIRTGRYSRVMLQLPDGGIARVPMGGVYQGWRLAGVGADAALFIRGGERLTVRFGAAAPMGSAAPDDEDQEEQEKE